MGNHAGKDNIGHTGSPLDFFQTPPSSPSEDGHLGALALASASSSVFTNKMQTTRCPTSSTPSHCPPLQPSHGEWALINMESPRPPVDTSLSRGKEKEHEEEEARTRRCGPSDGALSPASLPPSCSLRAERSWQEKDSGLESQLEAEQVGQETGLVMLSLMEYYRASLGLSPGARDDAAGAVELLRRLVSERGELAEEVLSLKETLGTERAEWRQFQRDLQVAVSVADRLRVEAEQALGALRQQHGTAEARLAQALRRQQEQDGEMRELQAQHRDARHQLSVLRGEGRWRRREPCGSDTQTNTCIVARDGTAPEEENVVGNQPLEEEEEEKGHNGREEGKQGSCSLVAAGEKDSEVEKAVEGVRADAESQDEEGHRTAQQSCASDGETHCSVGSLGGEEGDPRSKKETQLTGKGVAEAYIRRLAATKKTADPRRIVMLSERSWSLSRLPVTDNDDKNRPSPNSSATLPLCKKEEPVKGAKTTRLLQRQDSWSSFSSKKQDEDQSTESIRSAGGALLVTPKSQLVTKGDQAISIRAPTQWNSLPTELRPKDGLSIMLRRHGGSRRNALLRWCQTRTQGYKNIEITNFSSSWEDGLAFCAVYHTYLPSHIPYGTLTPEDKKGNLNLAFQTGSSIGITATLTVEEMLEAGGPNWQRVLGYVEGIFRHFEM